MHFLLFFKNLPKSFQSPCFKGVQLFFSNFLFVLFVFRGVNRCK